MTPCLPVRVKGGWTTQKGLGREPTRKGRPLRGHGRHINSRSGVEHLRTGSGRPGPDCRGPCPKPLAPGPAFSQSAVAGLRERETHAVGASCRGPGLEGSPLSRAAPRGPTSGTLTLSPERPRGEKGRGVEGRSRLAGSEGSLRPAAQLSAPPGAGRNPRRGQTPAARHGSLRSRRAQVPITPDPVQPGTHTAASSEPSLVARSSSEKVGFSEKPLLPPFPPPRLSPV